MTDRQGYQALPQNEAFYERVRQRTVERFRQQYAVTNTTHNETKPTKLTPKERDALEKIRSPPESPYSFTNVFLMLASIGVFYLTDSALVFLYDHRVDKFWRNAGAICLAAAVLTCLYCVVWLSWVKKVNSDNWEKCNPYVIPIATVCGIIGGFLVVGSVWPVWGVISIPIIALEFIGFIIFIAMIPDIF